MAVSPALANVWPDPKVFGSGHSYERKMIPEGIAMLKRLEFFMPKKYPDGTDDNGKIQYAIAYGHQGKTGVWPSQQEITDGELEFTEEQGAEILRMDLEQEFLPGLDRLIKANVTTYMFNACASLLLNKGMTRFKTTLAVSYLNQGEYVKACRSFLLDDDNNGINNVSRNAAGVVITRDGLSIRRAIEMSLFATKL